MKPSDVIKICVEKREPKMAIRYDWLFFSELVHRRFPCQDVP